MNYLQDRAIDLIIQYIQDNRKTSDDVVELVERALAEVNRVLCDELDG